MATKEVKFHGALCNSLNEGRNFLLAKGFKEMKPRMGGFHHLKELVYYVRPSIVHGIIEEARLIPLTFGKGVMAVIFVGEENVSTVNIKEVKEKSSVDMNKEEKHGLA